MSAVLLLFILEGLFAVLASVNCFFTIGQFESMRKLLLDRGCDALGIYGALLTGDLNTADKLVLIKKLTAAVTLYNRDRNGIHHLVGGKSLAAGGTLAAALDACAIIYRTGVKHS